LIFFVSFFHQGKKDKLFSPDNEQFPNAYIKLPGAFKKFSNRSIFA
jgi:hypothetical protein